MKNISSSILILITVSFFLPFVNINCSGTKIAGFTQCDLVVGKTIEPTQDQMFSNPHAKPTKVREFPAIVVVAVTLAALFFSFVNIFGKEKQNIVMAICGGAIFFLTVWEQMRINGELETGDYAGVMQPEFLIGYYLLFFLSLGLALVNGFRFYKEQNKNSIGGGGK